jgi:protein TonB
MIDLPPLEAAPALETPPEPAPLPPVKEAPPEQAAPPPDMALPKLPPAPKPPAIMTSPQRPQPKPKQILKELPKPAEKRTREAPAPQTSAPKRPGAGNGQIAVAPRQGTAGSAASVASWRTQVFAHLLQYKPGGAEGAGAVSIAFTLARSGRLLSSHLAKTSGSSALDSKALEMVRRANPFPPAPPELSGGSFPFVVPVRFR